MPYLLCKENRLFEETIQMREAARKMGIMVYDDTFHNIDELPPRIGPLERTQNFFTYGTRNFVRPYVNHKRHILSGNEFRYNFSYLMSIIPNELFNSDAILLTASEVSYRHHIKLGSVFLRPNSGEKQFDGQVFTQSFIRGDICSALHIEPWDLCIVASPKGKPDREYRFFVHNENIISCQYLPEPSKKVSISVELYARSIVREIREKDPNAHSFVLDIAEKNDELRVLELNSLNSSSIYCVNPKEILEMLIVK